MKLFFKLNKKKFFLQFKKTMFIVLLNKNIKLLLKIKL